MPPVLSEFHARFIDGDLDNPGAELRFESEIRQSMEGFEHGLLSDFLRVGRVIQHAHRCEIDAALIGSHEFVESFVLSATDSPNQFRIAVVRLEAGCCHRQINE